MDRIKTQSEEFDALEALMKTYRETIQSVAIVDDAYPQARYEFEGALQTFFEKAEANGRFKPNSRFGMRLPGVALLRKAAEKFRFYQSQHEQKYRDIEAEIAKLDEGDDHFPLRTRLSDTHDKARVNHALATEIEGFLNGQ